MPIKCPSCGKVQSAIVQHTHPFWGYVHDCNCGYTIMESEWEVVKSSIKITGPLRASTEYKPQPKPSSVEIGQVWRHSGLQGRPLCVIALEERQGCSTETFTQIVRWAVFRKGFANEAAPMLTADRWEFLGVIHDDAEGETNG